MKAITTLLLTAVLCTPDTSSAQVDPAWLRSWNEALQRRPTQIEPSARIAADSEPGMPLTIHGRVVTPDGSPASAVIVHAYHRDKEGFDFGPDDRATTTWRLQGWAKTDANGRFEFQTIRPAADHLGREAAHIHFTLESDRFGRQWAPSMSLSDEPLVTAAQQRRSRAAGKYGRVRQVRTVDGSQHIDVSIRLKEQADF